MTNIKTFAVASLLAVTGVFGVANKADAYGGCYQSLAAHDIATMIRGGASPEQAIKFAVDNGNINSETCLTSTIGYMRGLRSIYGDVLR